MWSVNVSVCVLVRALCSRWKASRCSALARPFPVWRSGVNQGLSQGELLWSSSVSRPPPPPQSLLLTFCPFFGPYTPQPFSYLFCFVFITLFFGLTPFFFPALLRLLSVSACFSISVSFVLASFCDQVIKCITTVLLMDLIYYEFKSAQDYCPPFFFFSLFLSPIRFNVFLRS